MTTTSFKPPEQVSVELPGSKSEIHVPETKTIILTVNKAGETYISNEDLVEDQSGRKRRTWSRHINDVARRKPRRRGGT